jgi:hypothetical protein
VEARKRKRAEDKVAKNEREAREKEAKRQKWIIYSAYLEERKAFHRAQATRSTVPGPSKWVKVPLLT